LLDAERHFDALGSRRALDPIDAQVTGHHSLVDLLLDLALLEAGHLQIAQRLRRYAAEHEWIPRHAVRIGPIEERLTLIRAERRRVDRVTLGVDAIVDANFQRAREARLVEVVVGRLIGDESRVLRRDIVVPGLGDLAANAKQSAERNVLEPLLASTAFDVAPRDVQRNARDLVAVVIQRTAILADERQLLRGEQRVVAVDRIGIEEVAARGDLSDRLVVREHQLRINVRGLGQLIVAERSQRVAPIRPLVVIRRAEVVQVGVCIERPEA
jgi:hypothetical protein